MTHRQLDDLRGAAETLEGMASKAAMLRDNPDHRTGNARRTDLYCGLSIIETALQGVLNALRGMADLDGGT